MDFAGPTPPDSKKKQAEVKSYYKDFNIVFWLYREATWTLFYFTSIVAIPVFYFFEITQMKCMRDGNSKCEDKAFSMYCWTQGTHTVLRHLNGTVGKDVPHPGIGRATSKDVLLYQWAYMWIFPYLVVTTYSFHFPWFIWRKYFDSQRFLVILEEVHYVMVDDKKIVTEKIQKVLGYLMVNINGHNGTAFRYVCCEIMNFVILLFHMYFTNWLLQGHFTTYGWDVLKYISQDYPEYDPFTRIFPKVTTCIMDLKGPSGSVVMYEGICILPLNSILEKIFVVLWFWYILLAVASIIGLVYRGLTLFVPVFRYALLKYCAPTLKLNTVRTVCKHLPYGDWFVVFSLVNSMHTFLFDDALDLLAMKLEEQMTGETLEFEMGK